MAANQAREFQFSLCSAEVCLMTSKTRYSPCTLLVANPGGSCLEENSADKSGGRQHIHVWRTRVTRRERKHSRCTSGKILDRGLIPEARHSPPPTTRRGRHCSELDTSDLWSMTWSIVMRSNQCRTSAEAVEEGSYGRHNQTPYWDRGTPGLSSCLGQLPSERQKLAKHIKLAKQWK